jgi:hypothetical protein
VVVVVAVVVVSVVNRALPVVMVVRVGHGFGLFDKQGQIWASLIQSCWRIESSGIQGAMRNVIEVLQLSK